jgi:Na+/H+ antiporter NhaD/arsenite permease-like protein
MNTLPEIVAIVAFVSVITIIIFEWLDMTVAGLLGALILVFFHVMTLQEAIGYISKSHGTLALFLGVMILVRTFEPTKVFDYLAAKMVFWAKGSGKLLLLGIVGITTPICAFLPNATTVMLLAPLIPPIAADIGVDFVPLLILMVFVANSAGLLTLVGDPVTYIIGSSINISFLNYPKELILGAILAILVIIVLLPILFKPIWNTRFEHLEDLPHPKINHPFALTLGGIIVVFVLVFFVIGESFFIPIAPASVALLGGTLALLLAHKTKIDTVANILRDVDWSTLLFFMSIFVLIGGLEKTGVINDLSGVLALVLGKNIFLGSLSLLFIIGLLSSLVPNIPLVVAMVPLLQQYLVTVGLVPSEMMNPDFTGQFPSEVLPLFYAMMYGATLGGNGTLVGASSNIVAAGIAEQHGQKIKFLTFFNYGFPVMIAQLSVSAIYLMIFFLF